MSGKSQMIGDFSVSRPSQIFPTYENLKIVDFPDRLTWSATNRENRECFYFPDASQISAIVGDHSRHMKTQICTVGDIGDRFSLLHYLVPASPWQTEMKKATIFSLFQYSLTRQNLFVLIFKVFHCFRVENLALKSAEHRSIENDAAKARVLSSMLMLLMFPFLAHL